MALTEHDRTAITDLINLHGHLVDAGDLRDAALALGDANPVGHHVTNIVITEIDDHSARVRSKGIGIMADGTAGSATYDDVVTREPDGWKIRYRKVTARRRTLGQPGPRVVLERWRQASIDQSVEDMRDVYAVDAVHEFPFVHPGVPSRFEGRDAIVNWIAAGWQANLLKYEHYRTLAVHDTNDPNTIVVEQEAVGTSTATGEFTLPNIVVLTVHNGQVVHLRDYVNVLAAAAAMGQPVAVQSP